MLVRSVALGVAFSCLVQGVYLLLAAPNPTADPRVGLALGGVLASWGWIFAAILIVLGFVAGRVFPLGAYLETRAAGHPRVSYRRAAVYQASILAIAWAAHPVAFRVAERILPRILNTRSYFEEALALVVSFTAGAAIVYAWHAWFWVREGRARRRARVRFPVWLLGCTVIVARAVSQTSLAVVFVGRELPLELSTLCALAVTGADFALDLRESLRNRFFQALSLFMLSVPVAGSLLISTDATVRTSLIRDFTSGRVLLHSLRLIFDVDGDGYAAVLGGGDCNDLDASVNPSALEIPGNGVDDNCLGGDVAPMPAPTQAPAQPRAQPPTPAQVEVEVEAPTQTRTTAPGRVSAHDVGSSLILVIVDSLRDDALGVIAEFGAVPAERLARFGSRETRFSRAYAPAPFTGHSILSFTTGRLPVDFGHPSGVYFPEPSIQEILQAHGYRTEAVYQLATINPYMFRGFDAVDDRLANRNIDFRGVTSKETTDSAISHLTSLRQRGAPFFLLVHYFDPHGEYLPRPGTPFTGDTPEALYWQEVRATDTELGRFLDELDRSGFLESGGVVAVTGDHGELIGDRDRVGHGFWVDEAVLRVPLVVGGGPFSSRTVIDTPVSLIDLYPTFLSLALGEAASFDSDGSSLLPFLQRKPMPRADRFADLRATSEGRPRLDGTVDARSGRANRSVLAQNMYQDAYEWIAIDARFKLVEDLRFGGEQLFDLDLDPLERRNIRDEHPEIRDRLYQDIVTALERTTTTQVAERKAEALKAHPLPVHLKRYAWRKMRRHECEFFGDQGACRQLANDIEKYGPDQPVGP